MNISKKYIKESFKKRGIQINEDAVSSIEFKLKNIVKQYAAMAEDREFKRVTPIKLNRIFKYDLSTIFQYAVDNENRF